jgi:hypothetical protein
MTEQEVYDNQEFKFLKKILKREFKWIKDLRLSGDPNRYSSLIFLTVFIDPWEFAEEENFTVASYVNSSEIKTYTGLSVFLVEPADNPVLKSIESEIEKIAIDVHNTPALPSEYKLKNKRFSLGYYGHDPQTFPKK